MFCNKCGNQLNDNAKFCWACGNSVAPASPSPEAEEVIAAPTLEPEIPVMQESSVEPVIQQPAYEPPVWSTPVEPEQPKKPRKKWMPFAIIGGAIAAVAAIVLTLFLTGVFDSDEVRLYKAIGKTTKAFAESSDAMGMPDFQYIQKENAYSAEFGFAMNEFPEYEEVCGLGIRGSMDYNLPGKKLGLIIGIAVAAVAVIVLLVTEALPMAAVCLLSVSMLVIFGCAPSVPAALSGYTNQIVFFIIASFGISQALTQVPLSRRMLVKLMQVFGKGSKQLLFAIMLTTCVLSSIISNVAAAAVFLPIILKFLDVYEDEAERKATARCYMIGLPIASYTIGANFLQADVAAEIERGLDGQELGTLSDDCTKFLAVYNALVHIDGQYYGSFFNYEYEKTDRITVSDFYPAGRLHSEKGDTEFQIYLNEDIETYLRDLSDLSAIMPKTIGIQTTGGEVSNRILNSLLAYCQQHKIKACRHYEQLAEDSAQEAELIKIAQEDIGIEGFKEFRTIPFYKNPDIDKEVIEISQGQIIRDIIRQAENSYADEKGKTFRDIFITASTGAGKSVMFQIPAVYLAKKYNKLTIIIEPVKALMQDQKEKLIKSGYKRVEAFNSDLITQVEKEAVLKRIKDGEVDLLYLSPETLLSYSIETIIGDREIGLLIIDEAHIVTTWGVGFRPDYWYLGSYINRLRHNIQTTRGVNRKTYHFPVCAFTATAISAMVVSSVSPERWEMMAE